MQAIQNQPIAVPEDPLVDPSEPTLVRVAAGNSPRLKEPECVREIGCRVMMRPDRAIESSSSNSSVSLTFNVPFTILAELSR